MNLDQLFPYIGTIIGAIATGIAGLLGILFSRWQTHEKTKNAQMQARENLKLVAYNGAEAVKAIQQTFPNKPGEEKKFLAMTLAAEWNKAAGIVISDAILSPYIEAGVFQMKTDQKAKEEPVIYLSGSYETEKPLG